MLLENRDALMRVFFGAELDFESGFLGGNVGLDRLDVVIHRFVSNIVWCLENPALLGVVW